MNGPEHYREAERLLAQAAAVPAAASARGDSLVTAQTGHTMLAAEAQVHATLALAAATAGHRTTWTQDDTTATYVEGDWAEVLR